MLRFTAIALFICSIVHAQQPIRTSICTIMKDPAKYAGQIVEVRATPVSGPEFSGLADSSEKSCNVPWFEWAPIEGSNAYHPHDDEQDKHPVFLKSDEQLVAYKKAVEAEVYPVDENENNIGGFPRYTVTANFTGRVDYADKSKSGFGHLGGSSVRFVMISVSNVMAIENSYNWDEFSREPVRSSSSSGRIRGKLIDANGKPISHVGIGAIPVQGKIYRVHDVRTDDDGNYELKVKPGEYLVVANYLEPARADSPVLTTYFPGTEHEEEAKHVLVSGKDPIVGIDIQVKRKLTPRNFDIQVLLADGTPATGAYVYLTQPDQLGIVEQGVTHTYADARATLSGFEEVDYLLWAKRGEQCAHIQKLSKGQTYSGLITVKIEASGESCKNEEIKAIEAAIAMRR